MNYPNQFYMNDLQNMRDRIDNQMRQLSQYQPTPITQNFQITPSASDLEGKYAENIDEYDTNVPKMSLYVIMNMLYSDFKSVFGSGDEENSLKMYIQASSDWYFDEDTANTEESKLYTYYKYIIK